jgi:alanine dehydrogenase
VPGAVPRTSTIALTNATISYIEMLADKGWKKAVREDSSLAKRVNILDGKVTYAVVAKAHGLEFVLIKKVF